MKKALLIACLFCSGLLSLPASANGLYQVEVIVFKYNNPQDKDRETWPQDPAWPPINQAISLKPPLKDIPLVNTNARNPSSPTLADTNNTQNQPPEVDINELIYHYLPKSDFKLRRQESRLANSQQYQVLMHVAWLQKDTSNRPIHLYGGNVYDTEGQAITRTSNLYNPGPIQSDGSTQWEINGTITANKSRYYNVDANLLLTQPNPKSKHSWFSSSHDTPTFSRYLLKQNQHMKDNELHYFDNPLFGVLVAVFAVKPPTAPQPVLRHQGSPA